MLSLLQVPEEAGQELIWQDMCSALTAEAAEDVPTQVVCLAGTTAAQRIQIHQFFVFYSRYARAPPVFGAPVGIG